MDAKDFIRTIIFILGRHYLYFNFNSHKKKIPFFQENFYHQFHFQF